MRSTRLPSTSFSLRRLCSLAALMHSVIAGVFWTSCTSQAPSPAIPPGQENRYRDASELFELAWRPEDFRKPAHRDRILSLMGDFIRDGHFLSSADDFRSPDPLAALLAQQQLLRDARARFESGDSEAASSRLRGLTTNCIGCHTRLRLPTAMVPAPHPVDDSTQSVMLAGQLELARRDYDAAGRFFAKAATRAVASSDTFVAVGYWTLSRVLGRGSLTEINSELGELTAGLHPDQPTQTAFDSWRRELNELENRPAPSVHPVTQAQDLLHPVLEGESTTADELHLVKTAYALRLLDETAPTLPRSDLSRKASYLTAIAYRHLPLPDLSTMAEQSFVQTIREYPESVEARRSYQLFEDLVETQSGGPSGTTLSAAQVKTMSELRRLSLGND